MVSKRPQILVHTLLDSHCQTSFATAKGLTFDSPASSFNLPSALVREGERGKRKDWGCWKRVVNLSTRLEGCCYILFPFKIIYSKLTHEYAFDY